jgi:hypothetical protein
MVTVLEAGFSVFYTRREGNDEEWVSGEVVRW